MNRRSAPDPSGAVLAVCGLAVEARIAAGEGVRTLAGGGRASALAAAIEREVAAGVVAVVSFGVAGALVPSLRPGAIVIATTVVGPAATYPGHATWARHLAALLPASTTASIAAQDTVASTTDEKRGLQTRSGAVAVDMESHVAAAVAARHGLPFAAIRAIADPLERSMPPAALIAMRADGGIDLPAVLASIARRPRQVPELLRIGADARLALRALDEGRRALGRGLGYLDLDQLPVDVV